MIHEQKETFKSQLHWPTIVTPRKKTQFIRKNFIKNKIQESNRKARLKIILEQNFQPQRTLVIKKYLMLKAKSKARRKIIPAKGWGSTVPQKNERRK